jgi:hypothetical protein
MQDIFTSIKSYLYDRATSPLVGAFVVAWSVWNYRFFMIIFSGDTGNTVTKFEEIDRLFEAINFSLYKWSFSISGEIIHGLLIPSAITVIYLFFYPLLAKPVYEHSLKKQKELRAIKQEQENQRLLSVEESREIYRRLAQMQSKHQEEIDHYNNQIEGLNKYIEELESKGNLNIDTDTDTDTKTESEIEEKNTEVPIDEESDIEEYDDFIRKKVDALDTSRFRLNQLFGQEKWSSLTVSTRESLGKRFRHQIERGDYVGVSMSGKDSGNQQMYVKSS